MPWRLDPEDSRCVQVERDDGWERLACHDSEEEARDHVAALRINAEESVQFTESYEQGWAFTEATKVDRDTGLISNVRLLGKQSRNKRVYSESAVSDAVRLYRGAPFYIDHPRRDEMRERDGNRSVMDLAGKIRNPRRAQDGVRGDLQVLDRHKDLVFGLAEQMPEMVGMSHRAEGTIKPGDDGTDVVEGLDVVHAVELVTTPATTNGLYESLTTGEKTMDLSEVTVDQLADERPDLLEAIRSENDAEAEVERLKAENKQLREQKVELEAWKTEREHADMVAEKLEEADLPDRLVTEAFREILHEADSEDAVAALIADRKEISEAVRSEGPRSHERSHDDDLEMSRKPVDEQALATADRVLFH